MLPSRLYRYAWFIWPLLPCFALLALVVWLLVAFWPTILLQCMAWQRALHQQMAELLQHVHADPHQAGWTLMGFSLVYGVIHAVGPGHGKMVITTYLATHPSRLKSSLQLTFAAALLQGGMAIGLVSLVLTVLQLSSRVLHASSFWAEKSSFVLVMVLGGWLCLRAMRRLLVLCARRPKPHIHRFMPLDSAYPGHAVTAAVSLSRHEAVCGCGHQHVPTAQALHQSDGWRTRAMVVLTMGLRPCSGAIMVLLFAKVLDVFAWGIACALAMACGTALTVSLLGVAVQCCRQLFERLSQHRTPSRWQPMIWSLLSLAGGIILTLAGLALYLTTQPEMMGGIRPILGQ